MSNTAPKEHRRIRETALYRYTGMRFQLLLFNIKPLVIVELLYTLLSASIMVPIFRTAINTMIKVAGYESVSLQNASGLLLNPLTLVCLAALVIVAAIYSLLDISAAIYTIDCSRQQVKVSIASIVKFSIKNAVRAVMPKNLLIVLVVLVMMPLVSIGVSSSFLSAIEMPAEISDMLRGSMGFFIASLVALAAMLFLATRWMYAIHYYTLEHIDFISAINRSRHLMRGNRIRNLVSMLIVQALLALINTALIKGGGFIVMLLAEHVGAQHFLGALLISVVAIVFFIAMLIFDSLAIPISCLKISATFYDLKTISHEDIVSVACTKRATHSRPRTVMRVVLGILFVLITLTCSLYLYLIAKGFPASPLDQVERPQVVAYRGDSNAAVENTIDAIEVAINEGADSICIDVQASRDKQIFLFAYTNFSVTCTTDKNVWDLDYDDIAQLTPVSAKSTHYPNSSIPLLSTALECAKEHDVDVIINVSGVAECDDAVDRVISIATEADYLDHCGIASNDHDDLVRARELSPSIHTTFISGLTSESYASYDEIDAIALDSLTISEELITAIQAEGKQAFAWRLTSKGEIQKAILYGIDAIVVSNVTQGIQTADNLGYPEVVYNFFTSIT